VLQHRDATMLDRLPLLKRCPVSHGAVLRHGRRELLRVLHDEQRLHLRGCVLLAVT
jgi:hypothetical protein